MAEKGKKESSFKSLFFRNKTGEKKDETQSQSAGEQDFDIVIPGELKETLSPSPGSGETTRPGASKNEGGGDPALAGKTPAAVPGPVSGDPQAGTKETPVFEPAKRTVWSDDKSARDDATVSVYDMKDLSGLVLPKSATFEVDELKIKARTQVFDLISLLYMERGRNEDAWISSQ